MIRFRLLATAFLFATTAPLLAQGLDVTAQVSVTHSKPAHGNNANVVVWLSPLQSQPLPAPHKQDYTLAQKDKEFVPHLLVVPTGSSINFPNLDPFFHNVFSLFNGKRFDLGLYEGHTHRAVQFDREGISYIFCNIHPDMGAVVVSLSTPYFATSNPDGRIAIHGVPPGRYKLNVWAENVPVDHLAALSHTVEITPQSTQLGTITLQPSGDYMSHHTNKFGETYKPTPKDNY
jgi:plastocyanin